MLKPLRSLSFVRHIYGLNMIEEECVINKKKKKRKILLGGAPFSKAALNSPSDRRRKKKGIQFSESGNQIQPSLLTDCGSRAIIVFPFL